MQAPKTKNRALRGAFRKGQEAACAGHGYEACPYIETKTAAGRVTWACAFRNYWQAGWIAAYQQTF